MLVCALTKIQQHQVVVGLASRKISAAISIFSEQLWASQMVHHVTFQLNHTVGPQDASGEREPEGKERGNFRFLERGSRGSKACPGRQEAGSSAARAHAQHLCDWDQSHEQHRWRQRRQ